MLLRKRAWDLMREEFPLVTINQQLSDAMRSLYQYQKEQPQCYAVAVVGAEQRPKGLLTMRGILSFIQGCLKSREVLREIDAGGFEELITQSCRVFGSTAITGLMEDDFLIFGPEETLPCMLDQFLKSNRDVALIVDGERLLGMLLLSDLYREISQSVGRDCHLY